MAATFDPTLNTAKDRVRLLVGDTDTAAAGVQDETIAALLVTSDGDENKAALAVADYLILTFARQPDTLELTGALKVAYTSRIAALEQIAARLRVITGAPGAAATFVQSGTLTTVGEFARPWELSRAGNGRFTG